MNLVWEQVVNSDAVSSKVFRMLQDTGVFTHWTPLVTAEDTFESDKHQQNYPPEAAGHCTKAQDSLNARLHRRRIPLLKSSLAKGRASLLKAENCEEISLSGHAPEIGQGQSKWAQLYG